jgi:hypothetical protein
LLKLFLHTGKHFRKLLWVLNNAMCCGWTFWFYQAFEFFFYSISFVQIFWLVFCEHYAIICAFLRTFSRRFYQVFLAISTYQHFARKYFNFFHQLLSPPLPLCLQTIFIPFVNSFLRTLCHYLCIFANIFAQILLSFPEQILLISILHENISFLISFISFYQLFFLISFISFYQLFANITEILCLGTICPPQYMWFSNVFASILSASLHSMYFNVKPAYTSVCMYTNLPW